MMVNELKRKNCFFLEYKILENLDKDHLEDKSYTGDYN
jgi:hypothetical protein